MKRVAVICLALLAVASTSAQTKVRKCVGLAPNAGWFSSDPFTLRRNVDKYLADAGDVKVAGTPVAIVAPHAGYRFSGPTAGYAFKPVKGRRVARVILMGPSHRHRLRGASIADVDAYGTPLGNVPLDKPVCAALLKQPGVASEARAHSQEHSLQAELPFLQRTLAPGWKLVPIVVGSLPTDADVTRLADALKPFVTDDTLVVVSSDFTHYGRAFHYQPFRTNLKENLRKLDRGAIDRICANDLKAFNDYIAKTRATICGRRPIAVMLKLFAGRADVRGTLLHYANSGDLTGNYQHAVSYAAVVLAKVDPAEEADVAPGKRDEVLAADKLSEREQKLLLRMARAQLDLVVREGKTIDPKQYAWDINKKLLSPGAVFVTLKNKGRLRGCIGTIIAREPLYISVIGNTINAARRDPRFRRNRITVKELPQVDIEISYLTPPKRVAEYSDIVIGTHGVILQKRGRRAVYLPQVPVEQKWDLPTMLTHLSRKARLPGDAWKKDCTFDVFEAQVFGEKELGRQDAKEDPYKTHTERDDGEDE